MWKENLPKTRQEELSEEEEFPTTEEEKPSKKRIQDPSEMLTASDIACGEKVRPVSEERKEFLRSGPDLSTPRPVRQTTIVTLQGGDLAVAELINFMLRGVVQVGELNAIDKLVELEVEGALAAMEKEDVWSCPRQQGRPLSTLRDGQESAKEVAKKEKEIKAIAKKAKSCHKITEFFKKKGGCQIHAREQERRTYCQ